MIWAKRLTLTLLVVVLLVAAALYLLVGQRTPLPPAAPHSRTQPSLAALPRITVCWIETAKMFSSTASALLVRHPAGDLLIDAGNSSHFADEIQVYPLGTRLWMRALPGSLVPMRPPSEHLRKTGADPARLRWFIPTHAHADHVGGLMDLPPIPVLASQEEIQLVARGREQVTFEVVPAHARLLEGRMTPIPFKQTPYEIFDESADLFGDGSIVIVRLPGHTPGSIGIFVNLSPTLRLFHVGDAVHDTRGYRERVDRPRIMRRTDSDPARARQTAARLHQLHELVPSLHILVTHGRDSWEEFFGSTKPRCLGPE